MSDARREHDPPDSAAPDALLDEQPPDDGEELLEELGQRWTTLGELGDTLPLAVGADRSFSFKPQCLKLRGEVGAALAPYRQRETATGLATYALAVSLATLQGQELAGKKLDEVVAQLRLLPWTSMIYLTYRMQLEQAAGDDALVLGALRCTVCGRPHPRAQAALGSMRVRAYGPLEQLPELDVELYDGLPFAGKVARLVTIRPARWDFMARLIDSDLANPANVLLGALRSAICRLDSHQGQVTPDSAALGQLSWRDGELLDAEHNLLSGGPTSIVQAQCQGHTWPVVYSWRSAAFFGGPRDRMSRRRSRPSR
jgi:hypothetical protein